MDLNQYGNFYKEYDLINANSYKIKSMCKYYILIDDKNKLINLIKYLKNQNIKYFILGAGSNIILPTYYDGVVIKLNFNEIVINDLSIEVGSSYMLNKLAFETVTLGLQGFEWAAGIPGTIGGSVIGNAGAYGDEIKNYIEKIEVLIEDKIKILKKTEIEFSYRYSNLKEKNIIITKAYLKLNKGNKEELLNFIKEKAQKRKDDQPLEYPSCGSVFRNPENFASGRLIEEANLKGYIIGGAKVSEKHANFIVNYQNASSEDIVNLINYVQKKVLEKYKIHLIIEPEIIK